MFKLNVGPPFVKASQLTSSGNRDVMDAMAAHAQLRLYDLASSAWTLDVHGFATSCGAAFLLRRGVPPTSAEMDTMKRTMVVGRAPLRPGTLPGADFLVYPLRPPSTSVGRSRRNDIVISEPSISAKHALFQEVDASWYVADNGSSNGTFVEEEPAPGKDANELLEVASGARVRLGAVNLTFLDALELIRLVKRMIPRPHE